MQTPPNYHLLYTLIKLGLLFGLVSQDDVRRWDSENTPADPFLQQFALADSTDELNSLINSRRIAGPDIITARALLCLIYQKLNEGLINTQQAMKAANAIHDMHLLGPPEQEHIRYLNYEYNRSIDARYPTDFDIDLLDFLVFTKLSCPTMLQNGPT